MNNNNNNVNIFLDAIIGKASNDGLSSSATRLSFRHPDAFLPAEVSEQLLANLCEKKTLSDLTITLFNSKSTRLRYLYFHFLDM